MWLLKIELNRIFELQNMKFVFELDNKFVDIFLWLLELLGKLIIFFKYSCLEELGGMLGYN